MSGSDAISPTAHYTGYIWARNGLSHPALETREGRVLFAALEPASALTRRLGGPTLENYLLARHRALDARVQDAIEQGQATQVLEVAAGLSPRGWRFAQRYGERITYIEADLPAMAERKRRALAEIGTIGPHHRVEAVDALKEGGEGSLPELASTLDPGHGLIIVTEGLLGYLAPDAMTALWQRFASLLESFSSGRYVSDVHLGSAATPLVRAFRVLLSGFVRGRVYLHFSDAAEAELALARAGFKHAEVVPAAGQNADHGRERGGRMAHILDAST
jgi:O-methyltransferase involved in polyketide biosynthesis